MHLPLALLLVIHLIDASPLQVPLEATTRPRKLQGRFLHITDMHPDHLYRVDASLSTACHRKKPKKSNMRSSYLGTPFNEKCDSPLLLTNYTLDFLDENWTDHIDFVVWTGDNARHDKDRKRPRTPKEIYQLNRNVAAKMEQVFTSKGIPVIPSLGNNDVWPHDIMTPGPNEITDQFSSIWKAFVPFPSYQIFRRGAYYSVEVIPNALAVISLNSIYFYDSNKAVGGCIFKDPLDPGNLQFDWLEVQLEMFRTRGLKVWLTGHVPPSSNNYHPECYVRYVELSLRYQDTILGHLFGHMNVDHFSFLRATDLDFPVVEDSGGKIEASSHNGLDKQLLQEFEELPKHADLDDFGVVNVSPSVVPTYLPSFRIYSYNISGASISGGDARQQDVHKRGNGHRTDADHCKNHEHKDTWRCHLSKPWYSDPDAPSRSNTLWTPLGYAQYYMPNLIEATESHFPPYRLEYLSYAADMLHPAANQTDFVYPVPLKRLPHTLRNSTRLEEGSKYLPYEMRDLTIRSWLELAKKLGDKENKKLRGKLKKYMFMGKGRA